MSNTVELPLFPLGVVLFPQQIMPLHIFEERYKLMIGDCLEQDNPFGVVLIRQGREVGSPATPFEIGTSARITEMQPLGGGRMGLRTIGERPFRIKWITQAVPYMKADVEFLDYSPGEPSDLDSLANSVRELFDKHLTILANLAEKDRPPLDLNVGPEELSYLVAGVIHIQMPEKQQLLEISLGHERLRAEATLLTRENQALQSFMYLRDQSKNNPPSSEDPFGGRISPN